MRIVVLHYCRTRLPVDQKAWLLTRAARYRQMATEVLDAQAERSLLALAAEYEQRAAVLDEGADAQSDDKDCTCRTKDRNRRDA